MSGLISAEEGFGSDLGARLWNEALNLHCVSRSWERSLPQLLHEWVDHGHGDLPSLLHLIKYLHTHTGKQTATIIHRLIRKYEKNCRFENVELKRNFKEEDEILMKSVVVVCNKLESSVYMYTDYTYMAFFPNG